jgi:hypothetical protein
VLSTQAKKSQLFPPNEIIYKYSYILMSNMTCDIDYILMSNVTCDIDFVETLWFFFFFFLTKICKLG